MTIDNYRQNLKKIPAPGYGKGCHPFLLTVADSGYHAGIDREKLFADIKANIPKGERDILDSEICDAVDKAFEDKGKPPPENVFGDGPRLITKKKRRMNVKSKDSIAEEANCIFDPEKAPGYLKSQAGNDSLNSISPLKIPVDPVQQAILFLSVLYDDDELLFIGDDKHRGVIGKSIRSVKDWKEFFSKEKQVSHAKFLINPLDGKEHPTKSGDKKTLRGDNCVSDYRYVLVEMDDTPLEDQQRIWTTIARDQHLPVVAVYYSGKKSLHALLAMPECENVIEYHEIVDPFYREIVIPLGGDKMCKTASRLSRLPGHKREGGKVQELLYLTGEWREKKDQD